jgi:hypothetical protein
MQRIGGWWCCREGEREVRKCEVAEWQEDLSGEVVMGAYERLE